MSTPVQATGNRRRNLTLAAVVLVVAALIAGATLLQSSRDTTGKTVQSAPSGATTDFGFTHGRSDAAIDVVIYEDFLCPACRGFEAMHLEHLEGLVADGDVQVEYRIMSFLDEASTTNYSTRAMNAYAAVHEDAGADAAQQFRMLLFANQPKEGGPGLADEQIVDLAVAAGADGDAIATAQDDLVFKQWIVTANDAASKDGVNSTPSVFVDGELLEDPFEGFVPAVDEAMDDQPEV